MQDKQVCTILCRCTLHGDCRFYDNGSITMLYLLFLIPREHIGQYEHQQQYDTTKEAYLTQPYW